MKRETMTLRLYGQGSDRVTFYSSDEDEVAIYGASVEADPQMTQDELARKLRREIMAHLMRRSHKSIFVLQATVEIEPAACTADPPCDLPHHYIATAEIVHAPTTDRIWQRAVRIADGIGQTLFFLICAAPFIIAAALMVAVFAPGFGLMDRVAELENVAR